MLHLEEVLGKRHAVIGQVTKGARELLIIKNLSRIML